MTSSHYRPAFVEVDLDAVRANASLLSRLAAPGGLCAVVKADGYSHGAAPVARAALEGGAVLVAVALVEEGIALREAGISAEIVLLSEPTDEGMTAAIEHAITPTLYSVNGVAAARAAARRLGRRTPVELKVDTGMHRVGASPSDVLAIAASVAGAPELELTGFWTHFAVADEPGDPFTKIQLGRFLEARRALLAAGIAPSRLHAANSAGAIAHPESRLDLVRCGIALYGHLPSSELAGYVEAETGGSLQPALSWKAEVHLVRPLAAGERTSYGRRYELVEDGRVAVVPLGYHDGVPRALATSGGAVLIGGRRRPIAGSVTMDQIIVDLGDDPSVAPGDEVVLIGTQGSETIGAEEWAQRLDTITYEVLCRIGPRVPRRYLHSTPRLSPAGSGPEAAQIASPRVDAP